VPRSKIDCYLNGVEVFIGTISTPKITRTAEGFVTRVQVTGVHLGDELKRYGIVFGRSLSDPNWTVPAVNPDMVIPIMEKLFGSLAGNDVGGPASAISLSYITWLEISRKGVTRVGERMEGGLGLKPFLFADGSSMEDSLVVKTVLNGGALSEVTYASRIFYRKNLYVYEGDLWTHFGECVTPTLNELFVDCGDRSVKFFDYDHIHAPGINIGATSESTMGGRNARAVTKNTEKKFLEPGRAYAILRPTPWDDERTVENLSEMRTFMSAQDFLREINNPEVPPEQRTVMAITDDEVFGTDLSRSSNEVSTVWQMQVQGSELTTTGLFHPSPPLYDGDLISLYGYRPMNVNMKGVDLGQAELTTNGDGAITSDYVSLYTKKLREWFRWQDHYLSGTISTYLNPFLRIGQWLVYLPSRGPERYEHRYYYITGVTHTYDYERDMGTTVLQVSRGTPNRVAPFKRNIPPSKALSKLLAQDFTLSPGRYAAIDRQLAVQRKVMAQWW